tara:strand:- start:927 stop:1109 length:183 start_codon:yes stop_codon:yes gene_type:complete
MAIRYGRRLTTLLEMLYFMDYASLQMVLMQLQVFATVGGVIWFLKEIKTMAIISGTGMDA